MASRLISAAYDHTSGRKKRAEPTTISLDADTSAELRPAYQTAEAGAHAVLHHLVRQTRGAKDGQRITELHAELIARTYLDGEKLKQVAAGLGMSESNASKHRTRAETLIARHLGRPDLAEPPPPA